jgi:hypothetical protein
MLLPVTFIVRIAVRDHHTHPTSTAPAPAEDGTHLPGSVGRSDAAVRQQGQFTCERRQFMRWRQQQQPAITVPRDQVRFAFSWQRQQLPQRRQRWRRAAATGGQQQQRVGLELGAAGSTHVSLVWVCTCVQHGGAQQQCQVGSSRRQLTQHDSLSLRHD